MSGLSEAFAHWPAVLVWGALATVVMSTLLEGAQMAGVTRLSLPFLLGTAFTGDRRKALILGYVLYALGGWLFAFVYAVVLESLGRHWWVGLIAGALHGAFLVTVVPRLMVEIHPRIAAPHEGPSARHRLEGPGPFGLHYGRSTPVSTVLAQLLYGLVFAIGYVSQ